MFFVKGGFTSVTTCSLLKKKLGVSQLFFDKEARFRWHSVFCVKEELKRVTACYVLKYNVGVSQLVLF